MRLLERLQRGRFQGPAGIYLRLALATAFLSAVADRFGLWGPFGTPNVAWGDFDRFSVYVGKLNWLLPSSLLTLPAWGSTIAELVLGITLLLGLWTRLSAVASCVLLLAFGLTMTFALGPEAPLSFSVFSASAGAFVLAGLPDHAYAWSLDRILSARPRSGDPSLVRSPG